MAPWTMGKRSRSNGTCAMCGGAMKRGAADIPFSTREGVLLIRQVPTLVCGDCGEPYMDGEVVDQVAHLVKEFESLHTEISVVRYKAD